MPSATPLGYPYPDPDDALTDYPAIAQELAELLEDREIYAKGPNWAYGASSVNVSTTATTEATAVAVAAAPAITADGGPMLVKFFAPVVFHSVYATEVIFTLWDGAAVLGIMGRVPAVAASEGPAAMLEARIIPAAGAHTYTVKMHGSGAGTSTVVGGAGGSGAFLPRWAMVARA